MKDSEVDWIGAIPSAWDTYALHQLVGIVKNKNKDLNENNLLSLSYGKIKRKDINSPDGLLPASFDGYNIIEDGDIVLRLTDLQNDHTSLRVGLAKERGIITSAYVTIRPFDYELAGFIYYILHAFDLKKGFYGMGSGVRQGLNYGEIKSLKIVLPPKEEISPIVNYLDSKIDDIDQLMDETENNIEDYEKWKASIVFDTISKGIQRDEFIQTNSEKYNRIPAGWDLLKFKYLLNIKSGDAIRSEDITEEGKCPVYGGGERIGYTERCNCTKGNILIGRVGARCGYTTILTKDSWASDNALIVESKINSQYLYYMLMAANLNTLNTSNAQPLITATKVKNCYVPYTSNTDEQKEIVCFLNEKCIAIDALIEEKQRLLSDLEKYKRSLVFESVTGKRKVV